VVVLNIFLKRLGAFRSIKAEIVLLGDDKTTVINLQLPLSLIDHFLVLISKRSSDIDLNGWDRHKIIAVLVKNWLL
jgi:hypothetical protein